MNESAFRDLVSSHPMRNRCTDDVVANYRMFATSFAEYAGLDVDLVLKKMNYGIDVPDAWFVMARAWIKEAKIARLLLQLQQVLNKP